MSSFAKSGQITSLLLGSCCREQAIIYSAEFHLDNFTAFNGWLQSFHGIRSAQLAGEGADVSMATIDDLKTPYLQILDTD